MTPAKWVAPKLTGGLGNRLFQTMAAIGIAERTGYTPVFLLSRIMKSDHSSSALLSKFFPTIQLLESAATWEEVCEDDEQQVLEHESFQSNQIVLVGYFLNTSNFPRDFSPILPTVQRGPRQCVAIHFRFGDYMKLPHHQMPLEKYYGQLIRTYPKGTSFVLFSDTVEKLLEIYQELERLGYKVELNRSTDLLDVFEEFARCSLGAICSNSTFAWWAAWFASKRHGTTYKAHFPKQWLKNRVVPWNLMTHPFTESHDLRTLPASPILESFSYY
jgi:hypothetical protein